MPKGTHEKCSEHSTMKNRNVIISIESLKSVVVAASQRGPQNSGFCSMK